MYDVIQYDKLIAKIINHNQFEVPSQSQNRNNYFILE